MTGKSSMINVKIGGLELAESPIELRTILGSCVGITMYSPKLKIGGMAHVVLPDARGDSSNPGKYANTAVEELVKQLKQRGITANSVEAKIAGGASMFQTSTKAVNIGENNIEAVKAELKKFGIHLSNSDCGGTKGRRMSLECETGKVIIQCTGGEPRLL